MTEYDYKARDAAGRTRRGRLRAASKREAAKRLSENGFFILRIRPARRKWLFERGPDRRFPVLFCRRLAVMLSAGMTLGEALRVLSEHGAQDEAGKITAGIYRAVADGESFSEAMARTPRVFAPKITAIVGAGEKSGSLDILLGELADALEADYAAREKLLTLMMYPCVLAAAVSFAAVFLLTFVFPVFVSMFRSLSMDLPLPTQFLLWLYEFFGDYGLGLLLLSVLSAAFLARLYRQEKFRLRFDRLLLRSPIIGRLASSAEQMRFAGTMSVLLSGGLVVDQALEILEDVSGNAFFRQGIRKAHSEVQKGVPLSDALRRGGIFSPTMQELIAAGEAAGETDAMLAKIASYCRLDMDTRAERVRALMPPISLLILGGVVGFIVFSAVLPLLDSMTAFMG